MKAILLILPFLMLAGCDIFNTRDAEDPVKPRSDFTPATTPDQLILNMVSAFREKDVQTYLSCLADTSFTNRKFSFIPSGGAGSQFPSLLDNWSTKNEEQYFNNVKSNTFDNVPITLTITSSSPPSQIGDSLIYIGNYEINIPFTDGSLSGLYRGDLKLSMIRDSRALWVIYLWQDTKSTDQPSWSELKGRFY